MTLIMVSLPEVVVDVEVDLELAVEVLSRWSIRLSSDSQSKNISSSFVFSEVSETRSLKQRSATMKRGAVVAS